MKRSPLRRKGGSRFPKRRDPLYMLWLGERLLERPPCDACKQNRATERAHLDAKGSGGYDRLNIALLCAPCHHRQEKRTDLFMRETGADLYAAAARWDNLYVAETGHGRPEP